MFTRHPTQNSLSTSLFAKRAEYVPGIAPLYCGELLVSLTSPSTTSINLAALGSKITQALCSKEPTFIRRDMTPARFKHLISIDVMPVKKQLPHGERAVYSYEAQGQSTIRHSILFKTPEPNNIRIGELFNFIAKRVDQAERIFETPSYANNLAQFVELRAHYVTSKASCVRKDKELAVTVVTSDVHHHEKNVLSTFPISNDLIWTRDMADTLRKYRNEGLLSPRVAALARGEHEIHLCDLAEVHTKGAKAHRGVRGVVGNPVFKAAEISGFLARF